jgi:MFS family permease
VNGGGTTERFRTVLHGRDFRRLLALRLSTQLGDGLFQAVLVGTLVFSPEKQSTSVGFAKALAILVVPYSLIGPFAGVFIDRWSRRMILVATPLARAAFALLVIGGVHPAVPFYAGALFVLSANRFLLTTATSVIPKLVPADDLLTANSLSTVSGTFTRFIGVVIAGALVDRIGDAPVVVATAAVWVVTSFFAMRIQTDLSAKRTTTESLSRDLLRVTRELRAGAARLLHTPRALAPIASVTWNQFLNGLMLVIALVVFKDRFHKGVGSFSTIVGAGGVGILFGLATVNLLEGRMSRRGMIALSFALSGASLVAVAWFINRYDIFAASFVLGLAFAWLKVPADTMTQESIPDQYRGRVFALYDLAVNMAGVIAALIAIGLVRTLPESVFVFGTGVAFLAWTPVAMRWLRNAASIRVHAYAGARADEVPRSVEIAGTEEPVEVEKSWREERAGVRLLCFRLELPDGSRIEVSRPEDGGPWRLDRELAG